MSICRNLRDVGVTINVFAGAPLLRERVLLRGGSIDLVGDLNDLDVGVVPRTIINLRRGIDPVFDDVVVWHVPADDRFENYDTATPGVQRWLLRVLDAVVDDASSAPLFIHCAAGRDRTGVVVAAMLHAIGIDDDLIVADYLMSDGVDDEHHIRTALAGLRTMTTLQRLAAPLSRLLRC